MAQPSLHVTFNGTVCTLEMCLPQRGNPINRALVDEMNQALDLCEQRANVVILQGSDGVFSMGADFQLMEQQAKTGSLDRHSPECMYALWQRLACGPFVSVCHLQGRANAGGVGFIAACDLVFADETANISLSELLFDITPACVLPFLVRKVGYQKAHYLALTTQPITVEQAKWMGLVDNYAASSQELLRKHLLRLRRLSKAAISQYKLYMNQLNPLIFTAQEQAIALNHQIFQNPDTLARIIHFVESGQISRDPQ